MHRAPLVHVTTEFAVAPVGAVGLQRLVLRSRGALFRAFACHDERTGVVEALLVADGDRADVDLEVRATPAHGEVGGDLGEELARSLRSLAARLAEAGPSRSPGHLEASRRCGRVVACHLALEPADLPRVVDRHAEGFGDRFAVGPRAWPIHERRALATIHVVVPQLDLAFRYAEVEQVQQAGKAVFAARERHDDHVVAREVDTRRCQPRVSLLPEVAHDGVLFACSFEKSSALASATRLSASRVQARSESRIAIHSSAVSGSDRRRASIIEKFARISLLESRVSRLMLNSLWTHCPRDRPSLA